MIGVVLWSDVQEQKAVIWCEDHGNLAFFSKGSCGALTGQRLDAGDVVQFDLQEESHHRVAHNPRLLAEDEFPTLASDLSRHGKAARGKCERVVTGSCSDLGQLIHFPSVEASQDQEQKLSA